MDTSSPSKKRKSTMLHEQTEKKRKMGKYNKLELSPCREDHKQNSHEEELASILDPDGSSSDDSLSGFYVDRDPPRPSAGDYSFQRTPVEIADQLRAEQEQLATRVSELTQDIDRLSTINEGLSREIARAPDPRDVADLREELKTTREALQAVRKERDDLVKAGLDVLDSEETNKLRTENKLLAAHVNRLTKESSKLELKTMELQNLADISEAEHLDYMKRAEKELKEKNDQILDLQEKLDEATPPDTIEKAISAYDIRARFSRAIAPGEVVIMRPSSKAAEKYGRAEYWIGRAVHYNEDKKKVTVEHADVNPYGAYLPFQYNFKTKKTPTEVIDAQYVYGTARGLPQSAEQRELFLRAVEHVMNDRMQLGQGASDADDGSSGSE
jgi:hypothetical protein